ncbi:MAG: cobyric acid synthase, partial [Rhodospirillales bacterium]|nr:cobyric acid synthase [Rhodospirillales bacterium]
IIVQGRVEGQARARDYHALKPILLPRVLESFALIAGDADLVLVEGAGSPAEINLRAGDIANMGFAEAAGVPVVLVGDIERGGVIAALVGTLALLEERERRLVKGYLINKFRGDVSLFDGAFDIIRQRAGLQCFGVVPWFEDARRLPQEDAMALDRGGKPAANGALKVAVPRLARIANFDDLDPLASEPGVAVDMVEPGRPLPEDAQVIVIPGSKATLADLRLIREEGWDIDVAAHRRRGGLVVGLCGGYQMLGRTVADLHGAEGRPGEARGLGLLDVATVIAGEKTLTVAAGTDAVTGAAVTGYEMHIGRTEGPDCARPWLTLEDGRGEGARSADGRVMGTYLHGLFAADAFRHAFLKRLRGGGFEGFAYEVRIEATLDALARHLEAHLDLDALLAAAAPVSQKI